jgi:hypothetical protein
MRSDAKAVRDITPQHYESRNLKAPAISRRQPERRNRIPSEPVLQREIQITTRGGDDLLNERIDFVRAAGLLHRADDTQALSG